MKSMEEEVACFDRKLLSGYLDRPKVFYDKGLWNNILENLKVMPRSAIENDYNFKQLVVYVVVRVQELYLTYRRTPKTLEKRLRYKYSIGIGGHVNTADVKQMTLFNHDSKEAFLVQAVWREIKEEIDIKSRILNGPKLICFINDDSTAVGAYHFGTVWLLELNKPEVYSKREKGIGKLKFENVSQLKAKTRTFESWSQLLIEYFMKKGV